MKQQRLNNKNIFRAAEFFLLAILFCFFAFSPQHKAKAAAWPAIDPIIKTSLERVEKQIYGMIMGSAKTAAVQALNQEMNFFISGSSGKAMIVTDWRAYLINDPTAATNIQLNAIIDRSLNGRGSLSNYISRGFEGFGANFSYQNQLAQGAKQLLEEPTCKNNYIGNPSQMFVSGNFKNLSLYLNGNDPWTYNTCISNERQRLLEENKFIAQTKVTSPGILGKEVNGITVTPAGLVEAQLNKVKTMGMDVITNAQYIPEIMTAVVSRMIIQGIGDIQVQIHREVSNVRSQAQTQMNQAVQQNGPGALYRR